MSLSSVPCQPCPTPQCAEKGTCDIAPGNTWVANHIRNASSVNALRKYTLASYFINFTIFTVGCVPPSSWSWRCFRSCIMRVHTCVFVRVVIVPPTPLYPRYGDLVPHNYVERLFICCVLVVSSMVHATIFGNITVQILHFDGTKERLNVKTRAIQVPTLRLSPCAMAHADMRAMALQHPVVVCSSLHPMCSPTWPSTGCRLPSKPRPWSTWKPGGEWTED